MDGRKAKTGMISHPQYEAFLEYWTGSAAQTQKLMREDGIEDVPNRATMLRWVKRPDFAIDMEARALADNAFFQPGVALRRELQVRWTDIIRRFGQEEGPELTQMLKASELLGKSLGAFIDRKEIKGELQLALKDLCLDSTENYQDAVELEDETVKKLEVDKEYEVTE